MSFLSRRAPADDDLPDLPYAVRSPEGLAARWVRWVAASGPIANPVEDDSGEYGDRNQPADVWFLAGSSGKAVRRTCVVPAGLDLFLPVINMWSVGVPMGVLERAHGSVTVDGVSEAPDVIATPEPFTVAGARLNGVTGTKRPVPVTVWGLWKHLPALPAGEHHIHAVGGDGYGFAVDVSYRLLVRPPLAHS